MTRKSEGAAWRHAGLLSPAFRALAHMAAMPACLWLSEQLNSEPRTGALCLFALFCVAFEMAWGLQHRGRLIVCLACAVGLLVSGFFLAEHAQAVRDDPARGAKE